MPQAAAIAILLARDFMAVQSEKKQAGFLRVARGGRDKPDESQAAARAVFDS
jgi:hypothetical protein